MAKATGRSFVIVENEFSEFSIDGPLLQKGTVSGEIEDGPVLDVRELSEGCICCSGKLDFSSTILTIANTLEPDYLLVEPSGVAFPGRILKNLQLILYDRIGLLDPITILDGLHYQNERQQFPAYFNDQVYTARHLVLSKSENFSSEEFAAIAEDLHLGEGVHFPVTHYSKWSKRDWLGLLTKNGSLEKMPVTEGAEADESLENMGFRPFVYRSPDQLAYLIEELQSGRYGYIVRAKGYCRSKEPDGLRETGGLPDKKERGIVETSGTYWYRFDYVDGQYRIGGCEPMGDTRAVVIGKELKRPLIKKLFRQSILL